MAQFTTVSTSYIYIFTLYIVLLAVVSNSHVLADSINKLEYQQSPSLSDDVSYDDADDSELSNAFIPNGISYLNNFAPASDASRLPSVWSRFVRNSYARPIIVPTYYSPPASGFGLRRGEIRYFPYNKRTIPIELQKALYAHGIVGRRR